MRKYILLASVLFLFCTENIFAQELTFEHGTIEFYTPPDQVDISAITKKIDVNFDIQTGEVDISVPIKSFKFEHKVMKKAFNKEYVESHKFPVGTFKAKVAENIPTDLNGLELNAAGDLSIHGITKETTLPAKISVEDGFTVVRCTFPILFKDFEIKEPTVLSKSVAKEIEVNAIFYFK